MSKWTHAICRTCWETQEPDRPVIDPGNVPAESCCWCGTPTTIGLYKRADPSELRCKGQHDE